MACVGNKERPCPTQPLLRMVMAEAYAQTLLKPVGVPWIRQHVRFESTERTRAGSYPMNSESSDLFHARKNMTARIKPAFMRSSGADFLFLRARS